VYSLGFIKVPSQTLHAVYYFTHKHGLPAPTHYQSLFLNFMSAIPKCLQYKLRWRIAPVRHNSRSWFLIHLPMRMKPTESSEMSAINVTWTPGTYPKDNRSQQSLIISIKEL